MFGGGGSQVGANVVLTADNSGYDSSMQGSVQQTNQLGAAYDGLKAKINKGLDFGARGLKIVAVTDVALLTAATVAAGRYQDQMRGLTAQSAVLNREYGNGAARVKEYGRAVDSVRGSFGETTRAAADLVQVISKFERAGSTAGLTSLATNFEKMSQTTGESASALATSVLTLEQTMGTGLRQTKQYSDQLVSMAEASNTSASSLANFASQIAPLGRQLNMTQSQITGFAAAFSKAGQDGYRASNVFSQMTSDIAQSLQTNSPRLAAYANLLGVTTQNLKAMSGANITSGLFDAIGNQGPNSLQTLNELGYDGLNTTRVVSAVTQQSGGVRNMIRQADGSYGNGAAGAGGQTASQQFSKLKQDLEMDAEAIGSKFLPALQSVMSFVDKIASGVTGFMQGPGGDLITVFAALAAPVAALAGGLLSLHGALLPLMGLMAIKRSAFGTGVADALAGRPSELGGSILGSDRKMGKAFYGAGGKVGGLGAMGLGTGKARFILTGQRAAEMYGPLTQEAALAQEAAELNGVGRIRGGVRKMAAWGADAYKTGHESLHGPGVKDYNQRTPMLEMFGGKAVKGALGAEVAKAEAAVADVISTAGAKQVESSTGVTAANTELAGSSKAASRSMLEAAADFSAAAASTVKSVAMGGAGIAARGAMVGGQAAMGVGRAAMAGMGPLGWGLLGLTAAPMIGAGLDKITGYSPPAADSGGAGTASFTGTGLSFPVSRVVSPVTPAAAGTGGAFDAMNPTRAQAYTASQASDYTNSGVKDIRSAEDAAAIWGPSWDAMPKANQESLGRDLLRKLDYAKYMKFVSLIQSGKYSTYGPANAKQVATMPGGMQALASTQQQINQGFTNQGGANLKAISETYLTNNDGREKGGAMENDSYINRLANNVRLGFAADYNVKGMATEHTSGTDWGGFLPWGGGDKSYTLNSDGRSYAERLFGGTPTGSESNDLGRALYNMPTKLSARDQTAYLLKHLSKKDRETVLIQMGIDPTASVSDAMKAYDTPSKARQSQLAGLGLSSKEEAELGSYDQTAPAFYGARLYANGGKYMSATTGQRSGITQQQLTTLQLSGAQVPGTIDAVNAYGNQQLQLLSPYMTPGQQLFGSSTGARMNSGMNAGMIPTPMGSFNGQFSLLGQAQGALATAQGLASTDSLAGNDKAMSDLENKASALTQGYTQQMQAMKQYTMTLDSMNFSAKQMHQSMAWAAEAQKLAVSREKSDEKRSVGRQEYQFTLQKNRAEADFARSRRRAEDDYNLQRSRAISDFSHQTSQMIKQAALTMHDVYSQDATQSTASAGFLLHNASMQEQTTRGQESQLDMLRTMGLSTDAIQQLSLTDSNKSTQVATIVAQVLADPTLIAQFNQQATSTLGATKGLATDSSSMSWQETEHQFKLSLDRGADDFARTMARSQTDFDRQMHQSATDFARQMRLQNADFQRQLGRQQKDYNTSVSHSWTSFNQQVSQSMKQMNMAAGALGDNTNDLAAIIKAFGKSSNIGQLAADMQKGGPQIKSVLGLLTGLINTNAKPGTPEGKKPWFIQFMDALTGPKPKNLFGLGGAGAGAGLPKSIADRMAADHPDAGYCLRDVADVLNAPHGASTAYKAWLGAKGSRHHMGIMNPIGAPIFFGPEYGGGSGHVAINAGGGQMWSEDSGRWEKKKIWPNPLGWSETLNGKTVASGYGLKGFAKGSWNLPSDMIAQIHKGEMIIPAKIAHVVRSAVTQGQAAGLHTVAHPVYSHVDARSYSTSEVTTYTGNIINQGIQNPAEFSAAMKQQARTAALAKR